MAVIEDSHKNTATDQVSKHGKADKPQPLQQEKIIRNKKRSKDFNRSGNGMVESTSQKKQLTKAEAAGDDPPCLQEQGRRLLPCVR
ncbi:MAG: hypothetical protein D3903_04160 [Candidatus Electrothrix sp. GM3_4]|nr:hypothetical protein [Candidatus Electrothrix sp. GM3_4]